MSIALHLGGSKDWWAFLALRSNPALAAHLGGKEPVILFDAAPALTALQRSRPARARFFFVLWDGYITAADLRSLEEQLRPGNRLELLCVGDPRKVQKNPYMVWSFFAAGPLRFTAPLRMGLRSRLQLAWARLKALSMPLKNLRQQRSEKGSGWRLLLGGKQLVFCGSHGLNSNVLHQLSQRHNVDVELLREIGDSRDTEGLPLEMYGRSLDRNGVRLAELRRQGKVGEVFFASAAHLLFRDFLLRQIRAASLPLYSNGYASGRNINVYTTPFYRQHVFLDFGSVVGDGNYPRRADLLYYRKRMLVFSLEEHAGGLLEAAAEGALYQFFEALWLRGAQEVRQAVAKR